jgi:hypothetical protein
MHGFKFFVPEPVHVGDLLESLVFFGRPVDTFTQYEDGYEITVACGPVQVPTFAARATSCCYIVGGRKMKSAAKQTVGDEPTTIGATDDYDLEELMDGSVKEIRAFLATRDDELFETDYQAMLTYEQGHKNRKSVVRVLRAALGEGEA